MFDYRWHNNLYHGFKRRDNCVIQSRVPRQRQPSVNRAGNTHHSSLRFFLLRWLRHIQLCLSYNNIVMVKGIKLNLKTKDLFLKNNVRLLFLSDEKNPLLKRLHVHVCEWNVCFFNSFKHSSCHPESSANSVYQWASVCCLPYIPDFRVRPGCYWRAIYNVYSTAL